MNKKFAFFVFFSSLFISCGTAVNPPAAAQPAQEPLEEEETPLPAEPISPQAEFATSGVCLNPMTDMSKQEEALVSGLRTWDDGPFDIDGDGIQDAAYSVESMCGAHFGNCSWRLYVTRGNCAHFVGTVDGYMEIKETRSNGLFDIDSYFSNGCAGMRYTETQWRFNGKSYGIIKSRNCYCEDDDSGESALDEDRCEVW